MTLTLLGSVAVVLSLLSYSAWIHGGDPLAFIVEAYILWIPMAAMVFLASLSLWEAAERWSLGRSGNAHD